MTDINEPTAWEDINPTTALARQQGQRSLSSELQATNEVFRNELTACLVLVVPVGMTEESRREWLSVAWATLKHLPPHILSIGAAAAREKCDHPSKIVPTIIAETKEMMNWRKESDRASEYARIDPVEQLPKPNLVTPEQAANILREYGFKPKRVNASGARQ